MSTQNGNFAELLKAIQETDTEAEAMTKALPADGAGDQDDQTIQTAAVDSKDEDDEKKDGDAPEFGKSMTMAGADGEAVEVIDATEILKSLQSQVGEHGDVLAKALPGLVSTIQKQGTLIKSLQESIVKLSGQGAGRRAMVMAIEKPAAGTDMTKSHQAADGQMTQEQFFAKADTAYSAGKITGAELNTIDVCRRMGTPIDQGLIRKVALS